MSSQNLQNAIGILADEVVRYAFLTTRFSSTFYPRELIPKIALFEEMLEFSGC